MGKEGWRKEGPLRDWGGGSFTQPGLLLAAPSRVCHCYLHSYPLPGISWPLSHITPLVSCPSLWPCPTCDWLPGKTQARVVSSPGVRGAED